MKQIAIVVAVVFGILLLTVSAVQNVNADSKASQHYKIGYMDGCARTVVPGSHTSEYLQGYADGARNCHEQQQQRNTQAQTQQQTMNPTFNINIH